MKCVSAVVDLRLELTSDSVVPFFSFDIMLVVCVKIWHLWFWLKFESSGKRNKIL